MKWLPMKHVFKQCIKNEKTYQPSYAADDNTVLRTVGTVHHFAVHPRAGSYTENKGYHTVADHCFIVP
jgi:hypothetical protein